MSIKRITRHLLQHHWRAKQVFPKDVLDRIEQAIRAGEASHAGQVRFVVEGALDGGPCFATSRRASARSTCSRN